MDFRSCVLASLDDSQIVAMFNQVDTVQWKRVELKACLSGGDLERLDAERRASVARFLMFIHRHVWRRVQSMRRRVGRELDGSRQASSIEDDEDSGLQ